MESRIKNLLTRLTQAEKASLTAGDSHWTVPPVDRLGIPRIKVTDGPNGARGEQTAGELTAACFPVGIALAATWDVDLLQRVGAALGEETLTKGAQVLLAPTVNIQRTPLGGRNFECYSEDPYLTARLAVACIQGVQRLGVGAAVKHYVCNDAEFERLTISSEVRERALREIYLLPFEAAVCEANVWMLMGAYNKVNGVYATEHARLLTDILKDEWQFEGVVVTDWLAAHSTVRAAKAGLDLEMPGPPIWFGEKLIHAVDDGRISLEILDDKVRRILRLILRTGIIDQPPSGEEEAVDKPEHRQLIREAGSSGMVLLRNEKSVLPLDDSRLKKLAVIGPNARVAQVQGGGSAQVTPHYTVAPLDAIQKRAGDKFEVGYTLGVSSYRMLPLIQTKNLYNPDLDAVTGWKMDYYNNTELQDEPVWSMNSKRSEWNWSEPLTDRFELGHFSARLSAFFTPQEGGLHAFSLSSAGYSQLYVNGELVVDNAEGHWQPGGEAFFGLSSLEARSQVYLEAGKQYLLVIEYRCQENISISALRIGYMEPLPEDLLAEAVRLAETSDAALLFLGLGMDWETEGRDRTDMEMPPGQEDLIRAVAAVNPNTVVVLNSGAPLRMPWLNQVSAVLQAWYPGQECGNAIADVLFGDVDPGGRLPQTFPQRLQDTPAYLNYPGDAGKVFYGEGIFVGYRYYDKKDIAPLFPFGYGLSYTTFAYTDLKLDSTDVETLEKLEVAVDVTNTGSRSGSEVVQLYVKDIQSRLLRPERELKAFKKVRLTPGEKQTVHFSLKADAFAYFDPSRRGWIVEPGDFEVQVGSSSRHIRCSCVVKIRQESFRAAGISDEVVILNTDSSIRHLISFEDSRAVLEKHIPALMASPQLPLALPYTLEQAAKYAPSQLPEHVLQLIRDDLAKLSPVSVEDVQPVNVKIGLPQRILSWFLSLINRRRK